VACLQGIETGIQAIFATLAENSIPFRDADFYTKLAKDAGKGRMLDLGCGSGQAMQPFFGCGWECVGVDVNPRVLEEASKYGEVILRQAEEPLTSLSDESFDLAVANSVFHLEDVEANLADLVRCVKPGRLLIINEVIEDGFPIRWARNHFKAWHGIPIKSRMFLSDWLNLFNRRNLKVLCIYGQNQWISFAIALSSVFPAAMRRPFLKLFTRRRLAANTASRKRMMFVLFVVEKP
jgi:SAM-dependent methyltransferase